MAKRNLLDTNAAIWAAKEPKRLGKEAKRRIESDAENILSAISIIEIEMKTAAGKLSLSDKPFALFHGAGLHVAPFDSSAAREFSRFGSLQSHDPFDRMIVSQAAALDATLITSDRQLLGLGFEWIIDAQA